MNFVVMPPEINSALIYAGAGSGPLLAAAAAWDELAAELGSAAMSFGSVTSGLAGGMWQGPSSVAMAAAAAPYVGWLSAAAASAESAAGQARAVVGVFEAALAATVDPLVIATNRSELVALALSNLFGQNTPAIAAAEFDYELMWAQDVAAMLGYHAGASAVASALAPFAPPLASLAAAAEPGRSLAVNLGLANVGAFNAGNANIGSYNLGSGNIGGNNVGWGNVGWGNVGFANSGDPVGLMGVANIGFGNAGSNNFGLANMGVGNIGFANTGSNNIGIGLTGDNLTGIGGFNSGSGNVGLFNSGTGNVGFFNSGTGNWGLFNSGSYNTGIGNSGIASTGWFNAGGFNTGLVNAGDYNTGSFNAGDANTGGFNPGSINTGWLNTGDTNTGVANSGNVNTGAFIGGNDSNGFWWRGNYQGLVSFSTINTIVPEFTVASVHASGGAGPITVPSFHIPAIPLDFSATGHIGGFTIPSIAIPPITLRIDPVFDLGPIVVQDITIPALGLDPDSSVTVGPIFSSGSIIDPFTIQLGFVDINIAAIQTTGSEILPFTVTLSSLGLTTPTPEFTIPGFRIPVDPIHMEVPLSVTIGPFVSPEITIPQIPVGLGWSGATPAFAFPPEITIDRIPVVLDVNALLGPINAPIVIPAVPGFGNATTVPSSGFFNAGGGGVSGITNFGADISGLLNQAATPLLGSVSGYLNFGALQSGLLNSGAGLSGLYNTSILDLNHLTSAFTSGVVNFGRQLSGFLFQGTGP
ncbi:hypothetical protein LRC537489_49260 [Mycobacterium riyadhense]